MVNEYCRPENDPGEREQGPRGTQAVAGQEPIDPNKDVLDARRNRPRVGIAPPMTAHLHLTPVEVGGASVILGVLLSLAEASIDPSDFISRRRNGARFSVPPSLWSVQGAPQSLLKQ